MVKIDSHGNSVSLGVEAFAPAKLQTTGKKNRVVIGRCSKIKGEIVITGNSSAVIIGDECSWAGRIYVKGDNQTVTIGSYTTARGAYILCQEGCDVTIGRDCMLSREIEIRTTDSHSIIDLESLSRVNRPKSIVIGDHVWIGLRAIINKGAVIPDDCVVASMAFVGKRYEKTNAVLAGIPAAVIREGITWRRNVKDQFTREEATNWRKRLD